ncbi:NAD(P)/FAD-dependent oxidoreductase [Amycolatopsis thermoflava]|uniref:NAD(P)/FAD-dependent oxidoreductase n=1 Tax=Amycolatopsis thermoflava TaxID=84480 RepID=UPI003827A7F5
MTTADPLRAVTVVGGGLAGFTVARELRSRGFDGTLRIVDPQGLPYDRPPLSKAYLAGEADATALHLAPASWYIDNAVEIVEDSAVKVDPGRRSVLLAGGSEVDSDVVVLATGGRARRLPVPGRDLPGVVSLRTRADADALHATLKPGCRLLIVGAGLIGAEVAATATQLDAQVTLVDPARVPLVPAVGEELAAALHAMHAAHGADVLVGVPSAVRADGNGLLVEVEHQDGLRRVPADIVLVSIGLDVDSRLAESAGLAFDAGIEVDATGATSIPAIRAAGDGIRLRGPDGRPGKRSEHWEAAMLSGAAVACGILGRQPPERPPAWFWSDRYGVHVEAVGSMAAPGSTVQREVDGTQHAAFRLDTYGTLVGCAAINGGKTLRAAKRLIARRARVDPALLADPAVDLRKIGRT